ncbi:hypothetical protein CAOG_00537 [Capsaspora owczarzaki ATCC 30864]|uniref:PNPLA domain-containing protein n=1 Tax=Capsaspora owczarzaki (strain ATCC 30864) TaxID=595528 RepID=A0A0D2VGH2_CAPO3|nr:hypothetical protein CAOG_00537 [Capsaspora owczarzaki ATCC 30864]KJE88972.1 hypothetical protein CAOG_000537 [Capsaspora owczarzaki ATCC 30864]|eukprot:XP_004365408.1 hypothetical protein CAOG_00537 [Capsaspora owczarzaki ATCC 30864]
MNFSFSGAGFLGAYHLGVAQCLVNKLGRETLRRSQFIGTSAGALTAAVLATEADIDQCMVQTTRLAKYWANHPVTRLLTGQVLTNVVSIVLNAPADMLTATAGVAMPSPAQVAATTPIQDPDTDAPFIQEVERSLRAVLPLDALERMAFQTPRSTLAATAASTATPSRASPSRVTVVVTRAVPVPLARRFSQFTSYDDLIAALLCSSFIPGYCGRVPPLFRGANKYIDGGLTDNWPQFRPDELIAPVPELPGPTLPARTIKVSPFLGTFDICPPPDDSVPYMLAPVLPWTNSDKVQVAPANMRAIYDALLPRDPKLIPMYFQNGYDDATRALRQLRLCEAG